MPQAGPASLRCSVAVVAGSVGAAPASGAAGAAGGSGLARLVIARMLPGARGGREVGTLDT